MVDGCVQMLKRAEEELARLFPAESATPPTKHTPTAPYEHKEEGGDVDVDWTSAVSVLEAVQRQPPTSPQRTHRTEPSTTPHSSHVAAKEVQGTEKAQELRTRLERCRLRLEAMERRGGGEGEGHAGH